MKKFVLIISIICVAVFGYSQRWQHIFGNPYTDEFCQKVSEFYDNGYLLSGSYKEIDGSWLIKTDINGNMLWEKFLVWDNSLVISGTPLQDTTGSIILAGSVYINNTDNWPMINKIDSCGNPLWCRVFIDNNYEYAFFKDAILLENQDILALAHHEKTGVDTSTVFLYYVSSDGDLLWKKPFGSITNHPLIYKPSCEDVFEFNGEYYISGYCYYAYPDNPQHVYLRAFFAGIDSLFNEKWILPFAMNDTIIGEAKSIVPLNDSVFMGVGISYFPEGSGTTLYPNSFLMFFNKDGAQLGYNNITNSQIGTDIQSNYIFDIARIDDTLFLVSTRYGPGYTEPNPFGEFIIDTSGQIYNLQSRPNTWGGSQLIKTYDDKYVICVGYKSTPDNKDILLYKINENLEQDTVYHGTYTYDSLCSSGIESGVIDITDCLVIVGTDETPDPAHYFAGLANIPITAYPNPATNSITFALSNTEQHSDIVLSFYDAYGRKAHNEVIYRMQTQTTINITKWNAGMYVTMVTSNGKTVGQCRFVVR